MPTPLETRIDVPLMLSRLVPSAEFHWKGNGWGTYADIGQWRSPEIPKPSEAEVYAEWDQFLLERGGEQEKEDAARAQIEAAKKIVAGMRIEDLAHLSPGEMQYLLVALLHRVGGLTPDGRVSLG